MYCILWYMCPSGREEWFCLTFLSTINQSIKSNLNDPGPFPSKGFSRDKDHVTLTVLKIFSGNLASLLVWVRFYLFYLFIY